VLVIGAGPFQGGIVIALGLVAVFLAPPGGAGLGRVDSDIAAFGMRLAGAEQQQQGSGDESGPARGEVRRTVRTDPVVTRPTDAASAGGRRQGLGCAAAASIIGSFAAATAAPATRSRGAAAGLSPCQARTGRFPKRINGAHSDPAFCGPVTTGPTCTAGAAEPSAAGCGLSADKQRRVPAHERCVYRLQG